MNSWFFCLVCRFVKLEADAIIRSAQLLIVLRIPWLIEQANKCTQVLNPVLWAHFYILMEYCGFQLGERGLLGLDGENIPSSSGAGESKQLPSNLSVMHLPSDFYVRYENSNL